MERTPNLFDRILRNISPTWALSRERAYGMLETISKLRKYSGASYGPLTEDWYSPGSSAKAEISSDFRVLRNRMRELVRNDGWAYVAVRALGNNIIGKGIIPSIIHSDKALKDKVQKEFIAWCNSLNADFYGRNNFYGLQRLGLESMVESGDFIMLKRYTGKGFKMKLSIQLLESDYLVDWYSYEQPDPSVYGEGAYVQNGIYYDKNDKVLGYELYNQHPGDSFKLKSSLEHFFVKAEDCVLCFRQDRPGQHRGVPTAHSVMLEHKMLNQYELAQAHKQTISASFALFITTSNTAEFGKDFNRPSGTERDYPNMTGERIRPGSIQYLVPGENIEMSEPPAADGYDAYVRSRLLKIAKGWGLTYEVLSGDLSSVNFSSGRMGWIEMHRGIENWQTLVMIPQFCNVVFNWWLDLEKVKGTVPYNVNDLSVDWTAPRREMIDPVKETNAVIAQILSGLKSYPDAIREMGGDFEAQTAAIAESNTLLDKLKLVFNSDFRKIHEEKMKTTKPDKPDA